MVNKPIPVLLTVTVIVTLLLLLVIVSEKLATNSNKGDIGKVNVVSVGIGTEKRSVPVSLTTIVYKDRPNGKRLKQHAFSGNREIFPIAITIGMPAEELPDKDPAGNFRHLQDNISASCQIQGNKFWTLLFVSTKDAKVKRLTYQSNRYKKSKIDGTDESDFNNAVENVKHLFEQLRQELGSTFEKRILTEISTHFNNGRHGIYIWQRENDVVAFIHTPMTLCTEKGILFYLMDIFPSLEALEEQHPMTTDGVSENIGLWLDE